MARREKLHGFGLEEVEERFPATVDAAGGGRHGRGTGLRPSRYIGRHRGLEETDTTQKPNRAERRRARKGDDFGFRKANDFGFGS